MKIALINVRCDFTAHEPRGILYIGAVLKKEGHRVLLVDPLFSEINYDRIVSFQPDMVGLSFMSLNYSSTRQIVKKIKSVLPEALLVAGGVHPSVDPESALAELGFDYVVMGEGEHTVVELCDKCRGAGFLSARYAVKGIAFLNEKNTVHITEERPLIADLDSIPFPARDEIDMNDYLIPPGYIRSEFLHRVGIIYSSRGCPGRCTFCCSSVMCKGIYRQRSVENVIQEIDLLIDTYQIDGIYFSDETFSQNKEWVKRLCEQLKKYHLPWGLATRVTLVDSELLFLMKEAGCSQIDYGVESGSDEILKSLKKGTNQKIIKRTFELTRAAGIKSFATVMVGMPNETFQDVQKTIGLLKTIKPDFTLCSYFVPMPGTEIYKNLVAGHRIDKNFYKSMDYHVIVADKPLINVSAMSDSELVKAKACIDQTTVLRNYLSTITFNKIAFYVKVFLFSFNTPGLLFKNIVTMFRTGRIDKFVGFLLNNYQIRIRKNDIKAPVTPICPSR